MGPGESGVSMMNAKKIYITEYDRKRLERLLERPPSDDLISYLDDLRTELDRAVVVDPVEIPPDVITMNSTVSLVDVETAEEEEFTLVFPRDADADSGRISVMAPLGMAMLGYRVGDDGRHADQPGHGQEEGDEDRAFGLLHRNGDDRRWPAVARKGGKVSR